MGEKADRKWAGLRLLFETWGAPLNLLWQVSDVTLEQIERRSVTERWKTNVASVALHASVVHSFEEQLERITDPGNGLDEEKRTRALSMLAKGLEPLVALAEKLRLQPGSRISEPQDKKHKMHNIQRDQVNHEASAEQDANRTAELDRQIEALIEGLAQEGEFE